MTTTAPAAPHTPVEQKVHLPIAVVNQIKHVLLCTLNGFLVIEDGLEKIDACGLMKVL